MAECNFGANYADQFLHVELHAIAVLLEPILDVVLDIAGVMPDDERLRNAHCSREVNPNATIQPLSSSTFDN